MYPPNCNDPIFGGKSTALLFKNQIIKNVTVYLKQKFKNVHLLSKAKIKNI